MSRSKPKRRFAWQTVARASALRASFQDVRRRIDGEAFTQSSAVSPSVEVFFQRVTGPETAPEAIFGVHVKEFEREWRDRRRQMGLSELDENLPFVLHAANIAALRPRPWSPNPPSDQDVASVREWLDRVFDYAKRLPSSVPALVTAIEANKIADHNVEAYLAHPVKVRGLIEWLHRNHGVDLRARVLPLLSDRTGPYDLNVMLGPPPG
jgi:hypothetical protein